MDLSSTSTSESSNMGPVLTRGLAPFLAGALGTPPPQMARAIPGLSQHMLLRNVMNDRRNITDPALYPHSPPAAMLGHQQLGLGSLTPGRPAMQFGSLGGAPPLMYNSPDPAATDFCRNAEGPMNAILSRPSLPEMVAPAFGPVPARQEPELSSRQSVGHRRKRSTRVKKDANAKEQKKPRPKKRGAALKKPPPDALQRDAPTEDEPQDDPEGGPSCCICMSHPKPADLAKINGCAHLFCFECIETWAERQNTCPLCLVRFTKIERVDKKRKAPDTEKVRNTKKVKRRDQRSDMGPGIALEGLLERVGPHGPHNRTFARLIFASIDATNPMFNTSPSARAMLPRGGHYAADIHSDTEGDEEAESFFGSGVGPASISLLPPGVPISGGFVGGISLVGTGDMPAGFRHLPFSRLAMPPSRSYATNGNDANAGRGAENPLHIDDSEEEDGDDSEVVVTHVSRPPGP